MAGAGPSCGSAARTAPTKPTARRPSSSPSCACRPARSPCWTRRSSPTPTCSSASARPACLMSVPRRSAASYPGVEIHATSLDNLLRRFSLREVPAAGVVLATLLLGLLSGAVVVAEPQGPAERPGLCRIAAGSGPGSASAAYHAGLVVADGGHRRRRGRRAGRRRRAQLRHRGPPEGLPQAGLQALPGRRGH